MITKEQTHPIFVDLKDQVELCEHRWPIEGSDCPYCMAAIDAVKLEEKVVFVGREMMVPCMCNGPLAFGFMQRVKFCDACNGVKPV